MKVLGYAVAILAAIWLIFAASASVSIEVSGDSSNGYAPREIVNAGKVSSKQTQLQLSTALLLFGTLLAGFGTVLERLPKPASPEEEKVVGAVPATNWACAFCGKSNIAGAPICFNCRRAAPPTNSESPPAISEIA